MVMGSAASSPLAPPLLTANLPSGVTVLGAMNVESYLFHVLFNDRDQSVTFRRGEVRRSAQHNVVERFTGSESVPGQYLERNALFPF